MIYRTHMPLQQLIPTDDGPGEAIRQELGIGPVHHERAIKEHPWQQNRSYHEEPSGPGRHDVHAQHRTTIQDRTGGHADPREHLEPKPHTPGKRREYSNPIRDDITNSGYEEGTEEEPIAEPGNAING